MRDLGTDPPEYVSEPDFDSTNPYEVLGISSLDGVEYRDIESWAEALSKAVDSERRREQITSAARSIPNFERFGEQLNVELEAEVVDGPDPVSDVRVRYGIRVTDGDPTTPTAIGGAEIRQYDDSDVDNVKNTRRKGMTDESGEAEIEFLTNDIGEQQFRIEKSSASITLADGNQSYSYYYRPDERFQINVRKPKRELTVEKCPSSVAHGTSTHIRLADRGGNGGEKHCQITLSDGENRGDGTTDADGCAELRISNYIGVVALTATKDEGTVRYEGEDTIEVVKHTVDLSFEQLPAGVTHGDTLQVRVTDGSSGVGGVELRHEGMSPGETVRTDPGGSATLSTDSVSPQSTVEITAKKSDEPTVRYIRATDEFNVSKQTEKLCFEQKPAEIAPGDEIRVQVTDGSSGVENVQVSHRADTAQTGTDGRATLSSGELSPLGDTVQITADKADTDTVEYDPETVTINLGGTVGRSLLTRGVGTARTVGGSFLKALYLVSLPFGLVVSHIFMIVGSVTIYTGILASILFVVISVSLTNHWEQLPITLLIASVGVVLRVAGEGVLRLCEIVGPYDAGTVFDRWLVTR